VCLDLILGAWPVDRCGACGIDARDACHEWLIAWLAADLCDQLHAARGLGCSATH